jgi:8-oxo-dGTP pyrophosphatase MutT (NUDIX family)
MSAPAVYTIILAVRSCMTSGVDALPGHEFLMVKNRRRGGKWELPGGRAEAAESPEACARREFLEETGFQLVDSRLLLRRQGPLGDGHVYLGQAEGPVAPLELETEAVAWVRRLPSKADLSFPDDPYAETFAAAREALDLL